MQADYHREEIQRILAGGFAINLKPKELIREAMRANPEEGIKELRKSSERSERRRDAYTADAKKRCKSVERLRKAGLMWI